MQAALLALAIRLDRAGVRWALAGSAGRALLGHAVRPADLDVEVAEGDAQATGAALGIALAPEAGGGRRSLRARLVIAGVDVDVTAGLVVEGPSWHLPADDDAHLGARVDARSSGRMIPVAPVEESLARAIVLEEWATVSRVAAGAAAGRPAPPRPDYLARRLSSVIARATR